MVHSGFEPTAVNQTFTTLRGFDLTLMLVHEGDGVDQGEILFMVASEARGLVGEG